MRAKLKVLTGAVRLYNSDEMMELLENPIFPHERKGGMGRVLTHEAPEQELEGRWAVGSATTARMADALEATFRLTFFTEGSAIQFFVNDAKKLAIKVVRIRRNVIGGAVNEFQSFEANAITVAAIS